MEFNNKEPIYKQVINYCFIRIIRNEWILENKIPSVRELASLMLVNPHTILKAYEYLQSKEIIHMKRGIGFYLNEKAKEKIIHIQKQEFFTNELPDIFKKIDLLEIDIQEIMNLYKRYK